MINRPKQFGQLPQFLLGVLNDHDLLELLALLLGGEGLELAALDADALEHLLEIVHEPIVKDRFVEPDVPEMALTLAGLAAGLAFELHGVHSQPEVIRPASNGDVVLVESRLGDLGDRPHLQFRLGEGAEAYKPYLCFFTGTVFGYIARSSHKVIFKPLVQLTLKLPPL